MPSDLRRVVVVGASLAGLWAVRALRERGYDGALDVVGAEPHRPYDRPPLSKDFLAGRAEEAALSLETGDDADLDVSYLLGTPAAALDPAGRRVVLADGRELRADGVVIATGARARALPAADGLAGVHVLRTLDDARALRGALVPGARLVVVGAGFVGAEAASTARGLGVDVTVVEALPTPLAGPLGTEMGAVLAGLHEASGVHLVTGTGVARLVGAGRATGTDRAGGAGRVAGVELADGRLLPADAVLVGIGAVPNVEWLEGSGLVLSSGRARGVVTDAWGATAVPRVVAAGDCVAAPHPWCDGVVRAEHWTSALEQAGTAAAALLGTATGQPRRPAPYFWSEQYGVRVQFAGSRRDGDAVRVVEGAVEDRRFVALYERGGAPVAVLAVEAPRLFGRYRRQLALPRPAGEDTVPARGLTAAV